MCDVPALRFPEFTEEWRKDILQNVVMFSNGKAHENCVDENGHYILVNSKFVSTDGSVFKKVTAQLSPLFKSQFVMVMSDLPNGKALAKCYYIEEDNIYTLNQRICSFSAINGNISRFLMFQICRNKYYLRFDDGINQTNLKKREVLACPVFIPSKEEQTKIAVFLHLLDKRISIQNKIIEKLETLIKGIRYNIFKQLRKNVGFNATIGNILSFEQPQRYIVSSAEYSKNDTFTPVLTANKAFILGYTTETDGIYNKGDCIIIDDFTLDCKYVSFPFKVKSSAIKILTAKNKFILRYTYEYLKSLELSTEEHKRHYIAEVQPHSCVLPEENTLKTIALLFENLACKLANEQSLVLILNKQKQYLLSKMLI